jgi:hypothetical protein
MIADAPGALVAHYRTCDGVARPSSPGVKPSAGSTLASDFQYSVLYVNCQISSPAPRHSSRFEGVVTISYVPCALAIESYPKNTGKER